MRVPLCVAALIPALVLTGASAVPSAPDIGVFLRCTGKSDPREGLEAVRLLGLRMVQISKLPDRFYTPEGAKEIAGMLKEAGIRATSVVAVYDGERYGSIQSVRDTVGFLPEATIPQRIEYTKKCIDFAATLGIRIVTFHAGYLPSDAADPAYLRVVAAVSEVARYASGRGVTISLETGQESAEELLDFIARIKGGDVKVNFDVANLVLYGRDDPPSALRRLLPKVTSVHVKDGIPPAEHGRLGIERRLGEGRANVKECLRVLKEAGFQGPLVIENYMARSTGDDPVQELARAKAFIEKIHADLK